MRYRRRSDTSCHAEFFIIQVCLGALVLVAVCATVGGLL
jgi:hypothetical protein